MLLNEAQRLAHKHMEEWGLLDKGWKFKFDSARTRFGQCRYSLKTISLSKYLVGLNTREQVEDTILHEIAHALAGSKANHGPDWKHWCKIVGANPEACYDGDIVARAPHRWEGHCPYDDCDMVYKRQRLRDRSKYGYCGKCKRQGKGRLQWRQVEPPIKGPRVVEFIDDLPD